MDGTVGMMVLSGLCFLPSYSLRLYILVTQLKTWTDAQSYCRSMYTDLATVQNEEQLAELNQLIGTNPSVWIGLSADTEAWRWSLENQAYYGKGEADFRMWNSQEPNGGGYYKVCVAMATGGTWTDQLCINTLAFICYNEPVVRKLVVQVELEKSDSSVDMEDLKDILQQFHQRLNKGVQMRWVEHPNGEVFQKKTTDTEEKNICTLE
ncbi:hypothetical protein Q8A73_016813 [Channa argus]|nr:hypothetical protein Q8A73_016813 [Channa argus]